MSDTRAMESSATPLQFDASFESGNLAEARLIAEVPLEYDLHIRPDTLNSRHRVWFYFAVRGATRGQKVIFNLIGYSKTKSLYRDGMAPVVCTSARPHWERMPESSVYYYKSPRHGKHYVLSFPFCFDRKDARKEEVYYFAYCFPYTYSYLQRFLHSLDAAQLPWYRRECLCRTVQHRRLDLVTISSPANLALDAAAKRHRGRFDGFIVRSGLGAIQSRWWLICRNFHLVGDFGHDSFASNHGWTFGRFAWSSTQASKRVDHRWRPQLGTTYCSIRDDASKSACVVNRSEQACHSRSQGRRFDCH